VEAGGVPVEGWALGRRGGLPECEEDADLKVCKWKGSRELSGREAGASETWEIIAGRWITVKV
jgi:hypothetical protein